MYCLDGYTKRKRWHISHESVTIESSFDTHNDKDYNEDWNYDNDIDEDDDDDSDYYDDDDDDDDDDGEDYDFDMDYYDYDDGDNDDTGNYDDYDDDYSKEAVQEDEEIESLLTKKLNKVKYKLTLSLKYYI